MLYTKTNLKALLSELKAKVKQVEEDKNSLEEKGFKSQDLQDHSTMLVLKFVINLLRH